MFICGRVSKSDQSALVIDGEAVCCDSGGVANFEKLHSQAHDDTVFPLRLRPA